MRALVRPTSPRDNLCGLDCELVVGDLTDKESLKAAMKDVRYLFHVAADYRLWARDPSVILRANVEGTRSLDAAKRWPPASSASSIPAASPR